MYCYSCVVESFERSFRWRLLCNATAMKRLHGDALLLRRFEEEIRGELRALQIVWKIHMVHDVVIGRYLPLQQ